MQILSVSMGSLSRMKRVRSSEDNDLSSGRKSCMTCFAPLVLHFGLGGDVLCVLKAAGEVLIRRVDE